MIKQKHLLGIILPLIILFIWQILTLNANPYIYPSPIHILTALISVFSEAEVFTDSISTLFRLFLGFLFGTTAGIFLGVIVAYISRLEKMSNPVINFVRFIPPLALVPLTLIWFGIGEFSKIFIIFWTVFFPIYINTLVGAKNVNKKFIWVAKVFGATRKQVFTKVIIPATMPFIIAGARLGLGLAFSVVIAAELVGAFSGLGFRIWFFQSVFRVDKMIVYILLLGLYGFILDTFLQILSRKLFFWGEKPEL